MNPHPEYPLLLSPIQVGAHVLRNRVIMGSMHTRLENEPDAVERLTAFYATRARGGVALVITGGTAPNFEGRVEEGAQVLDTQEALREHIPLVAAVHAEGAKLLLQVLHTGIYGKHPELVGPSAVRSPINSRTPRELSTPEVASLVDDFVRCAALAAQAGYDGVEIMGSEGYLLSQFLSPVTNRRSDCWGGSFDNRARLPVEIVRRTRERLGRGFLISYRISAIDLMPGGLCADEIDELARRLQSAGVDLFNTGIGWHESPVPTIAASVPRAAFAFAAARLKQAVNVPVVASNRINMPATAETILREGQADMVSMARPLLADPELVNKAASGRTDEINTCIACNQACLDRIFEHQVASCLVNPLACHETQFPIGPAARPLRVAVVGAGPAGMACAATAAERGHHVVLYEAAAQAGGQIHLARRIPGKQEFNEFLRYFTNRLARAAVDLRLGQPADAQELLAAGYDHVVLATGIRPRGLDFPGSDHPKVVSYVDVILGNVQCGPSVAVIGTGGIGHDVAELLTAETGHAHEPDIASFFAQWGVDPGIAKDGGLVAPQPERAARQLTLFQRTPGKSGTRLGKTTGWILRMQLQRRGVKVVTGCSYERIDDEGLHYRVGGELHVLPVDHVVVCAGQEPENSLWSALQQGGASVHAIGGASRASELDAMRAIDEATRLAYSF